MAGEVTFTPSATDYLDANRDWFFRAIRQRWALIKLAGMIAFAALVGGLSSLLDDDPSSAPFRAVGFSFLAMAVAGLVYAVCYLTLPQRTRRIYRQQKSLQQPWRYAWSHEGLDFSSMNGTAKLAWSDMYRWSDGPRTFLFFVNEQIFYFIPFYVLSPEQAEDLRATAATLGPRRF